MWCPCLMMLLMSQRLYASSYSHVENYETVQPIHINSEIVNDWDLSTRVRNKNYHFDDTRYVFTGYGRTFDLRITKNKNLVKESLTIITQSIDGKYQVKEGAENCYYHGFVFGRTDSQVTVTTCFGLRGVIRDVEEYFIEPSEEFLFGSVNHSNKHILYKTEHIKLEKDGKCGGAHTENTAQPQVDVTKMERNRHKRSVGIKKYIETVVVMDNRAYRKYGMNGSIQRVVEVMNFVDSIYKTLDTRVALTSVIVWNVFDMIKISENPSATLKEFRKYREEVLRGSLRLGHDNAQLITGINFNGTTVGFAFVGVICSSGSCGVNQDYSRNAFVIGNTIAHEMGHNLGMYHFNSNCTCLDPPCAMTPNVNSRQLVKGFSDCSIKAFNMTVSTGEMACADNYPENLYGDADCGNGYKEKGEECDCGTEMDCKKSGAIKCCDHKTCKLHPSAQCADGLCCEDCKYKLQGALCRDKFDEECDLEERCTGYSNQCPKNFYLKDGTSCENGAAYCYEGSCRSLDRQCQTLWGPNAVNSPHQACYNLNTRGSEYMNCGKDLRGTPMKCESRDVLCGTLLCDKKSSKQSLPNYPIIGSGRYKRTSTISSNTGRIQCVLAFTTSGGAEMDGPTFTLAGTKCGDGMICLANKCINISALSLKPCPGKCLNGGVCNNNGNCHCKPGYACPYCELAGPGGSFDSGQGCVVMGDCECLSSWAKAVLVLVFVVLPLVIFGTCLCYRYKKAGSISGTFDCCRQIGRRSLPRKAGGLDEGANSSSEMSTPPISTVKATSSRRPPPPPPSGKGAYPFG